jgi:Bacterial membrane protein YfhO
MSTTSAIDAGTPELEKPPEPSIRRDRGWNNEFSAAMASAVLAMGAFCLSLLVRRTYPFGTTSRAVNDLANQFVPFHTELWDLQHGVASGDLFFSWSSGYGVAFLPDFFSFLGNPFSWMVGLFPRDMVDFPVFLVTLLSLGLAAGLMTVFLGHLHPGSRWWRVLLGVGYGLCGWMINDAFADPMWTWGLAALPALGIAADWCLQRQRWVLGTLIVAAAWVGNFYTAAMATIATGLVLVVRLLLSDAPLSDRLRVILRAGSMVLIGVLLAAPVLTVCLLASRSAQPPPQVTYPGPPPLLDIAAQFLPAGRSPHARPDVSIGLFGLLLVAAFPFHRSVRLKERLVWLGLLVLVMLSFFWVPTILIWHGLALPNGSPYRAAMVYCGLLTMVAWLSLARRPPRSAVLVGAVLIVAILLLARNQAAVRQSTWFTVLVGGPLMVAALLVLLRSGAAPWVRRGTAAVLTAAVFFSSAYSAYVADSARAAIPFFNPLPTMVSDEVRVAFDAVQAERSWPNARVETGPHRFANNDPKLLRAEGSRFYDTYVPAKTSQALQSLGIPWTWRGRHIHSPTDPVTRALMGVSFFLEPTRAKPGFAIVPAGRPAPLVTVHAVLDASRPVASVFARQEALLGGTVYQVPTLHYQDGPTPTRTTGGWLVPRVPNRSAKRTTFSAKCTPGSEAYFYTPWFAGSVRGPGVDVRFVGREPLTSNPMQLMGTVPADGDLRIAVAAASAQVLPDRVVGCLDRAKLTAAIERLRARGATRIEAGGHTISATLPAGSSGMAVLAIPAVNGWSCSANGASRTPPASFQGFIGVRLVSGASRVDCSFEPPGLRAGLAISGLSLVALLAVALIGSIRARRQRATVRVKNCGNAENAD